MNTNRQKISFFKRQALGVWIDPIFEPLKAKTSRYFSVMLLTENKLIGSLAEADLQAISIPKLETS